MNTCTHKNVQDHLNSNRHTVKQLALQIHRVYWEGVPRITDLAGHLGDWLELLRKDDTLEKNTERKVEQPEAGVYFSSTPKPIEVEERESVPEIPKQLAEIMLCNRNVIIQTLLVIHSLQSDTARKMSEKEWSPFFKALDDYVDNQLQKDAVDQMRARIAAVYAMK